jgi:ABC-type transporter Mla subunit MlaD
MTPTRAAWAAALATAVLVQAGTAAADAGVTAVATQPGRARPAESGAHDSAATLGPLAIGAAVTDPNGLEVGRVTRVTTGKNGRSLVEVRLDDDVFSIPAEGLYTHGGKAFSAETLDQLKHSAAAH